MITSYVAAKPSQPVIAPAAILYACPCLSASEGWKTSEAVLRDWRCRREDQGDLWEH
jgi:hypothetical protein